MYEQLIKNVIIPLGSSLSSNKGWKYYQKYIQSEFDDKQTRRERQWKKLQEMVFHAYENVPFYKTKFDQVSLKPEDIKTYEDFQKIPITTKKELRDHFPHDVIAQNYSSNQLRYSNTSGTSGHSLILVHDHTDINYKYASKLRSRYLMGSMVGESILRITSNECQPCLPDGSSPSIGLLKYLWMWISNHPFKHQAYYVFLEKSIINPILHRRCMTQPLQKDLSEESVNSIIGLIKKHKPQVITGYPLYLYLLARYIKEKKVDLPSLKIIDLTAGLSTKEMREYLSQQFHAPVYQIYGGCEFGRFASSCPHSDGLMHILEDHCYVEFIDRNGRPSGPGELSNIIVTSLTAKGLPFIRYEHGDVGKYYDQPCACGRTTQLMDVEGRLQDLIVTKEGKIYPSQFFLEKFVPFEGLDLFQLIQKKNDRFEFKMVVHRGKTVDTHKIEQMLKEYLGSFIQIEFKKVDYIEPAASGKYRLIRSNTYSSFRCEQNNSKALGNYW